MKMININTTEPHMAIMEAFKKDASSLSAKQFADKLVDDTKGSFEKPFSVHQAMSAVQEFRKITADKEEKEVLVEFELVADESLGMKVNKHKEFRYFDGSRISLGVRAGIEVNGELVLDKGIKESETRYSESFDYKDILTIAEEKALEVEIFDSFFHPSEDEETGCPKLFETCDEEREKAKAEALKHASKSDQLYRHIWTVVDGDSGDLIVLNGWHLVNRVHYMVTKTPWGDGSPADADVYIEAQY